MWNYSEMFGSKELKKAVMEYIECRFDSLIHSNLLEYLGFYEIQVCNKITFKIIYVYCKN